MTDGTEFRELTWLSRGWASQADSGRWCCTTSRQNPPVLPRTVWWTDAPDETGVRDVKMSWAKCRTCTLTISCFRSALSAGFLTKLQRKYKRITMCCVLRPLDGTVQSICCWEFSHVPFIHKVLKFSAKYCRQLWWRLQVERQIPV